jgi:hypothetical protein
LPAEADSSGQSGVSGALPSGGTLPGGTGGLGQSGAPGAVASGGTLPGETGGSGQSGVSGAVASGGTLPGGTGGSGQSGVSGAVASGGDDGGRSSKAGSGGLAPNAGAPSVRGSNGGTATAGTGAQPEVGGAGGSDGEGARGGSDDGDGGTTAGGGGGDEWAEGEFRVCVSETAYTRAKVYRYDAATASCVTLMLEAPGCSLGPGFLVDDAWCLADAMVVPNVESCDSTDPPITDPTPFLAESVTGSFSVSAGDLLEADVALTFASGGPPDQNVEVSGCRLVGCGADDCRP